MPTPRRTRPREAPANTTAPTSVRAAMIRRAPARSRSTASGTCATAKAQKKTALTMPSPSDGSPRSRSRSGAITAFLTR